MHKSTGLLLLLLTGCGLILSPEEIYDEDFPKKDPFDYFYSPMSREGQEQGSYNPFSIDSSTDPVSIATYRSPTFSGNSSPHDTVEICQAGGGCTRTLIEVKNASERGTHFYNRRGIKSVQWKEGKLWIIRHFDNDPGDTLFQVDLERGVLDFALRDSTKPSILPAWLKPYGVDSLSSRDTATDDGGNIYTWIRGYNPDYRHNPKFVMVTKWDSIGTILWEKKVEMEPTNWLWMDGHLYLSGTAGTAYEGGATSYTVIAKLTPSGSVVWLKGYHNGGGSKNEAITSLHPLKNGEFLALGYSGAMGAAHNYALLLKIKENGDASFERLFTKTEKDIGLGRARILNVTGSRVRAVFSSSYSSVRTGPFFSYAEFEF